MLEMIFIALGAISLVLLLILLYVWGTYNAFVQKRNQVKTDFSDIDVQIKRRASLVGNLANLDGRAGHLP